MMMMFIYIYICFIIQCVKVRAIPYPHQLPTRVITVSVAQGGAATPGATKQLLPPDRIFKKYISIYTPDQLKQTLHWTFVHPFRAVSDFKMRLLSAVDVIATVS